MPILSCIHQPLTTQVCGQNIVLPFYGENIPEDGNYISKSISVVVVLIVALVNSYRVSLAVRVQELFSVLQFLALAVVCICGLVYLTFQRRRAFLGS